MSTNIRKIAIDLLRSYEEGGRYVNLLLNAPALKKLTNEERSSVTALLYTTVEKKLTYDYFISSFSGRPISEIDVYVRDVLRLGLCQVLDMESIPDFAAVNESVKLSRHKGEAGFINAVLRRAVKNKNNMPYPKREKNLLRFLGIYYSVPYETVKFFARIFGEEECEKLLSAFSRQTGLSLTVNENKISRDELLSKLEAFGAEKSKYTDNGIVINNSVSPKALPGFSEGEFFVQDEASAIAAEALDIKMGDTVIDVCSAPGGKALATAIKLGESGRVYAFDLHESKLSLIRDSAQRLGLTNMEIEQNDALTPKEELLSKADRVICDVPCSGLGVFGKKPDLRYKDISTVNELPSLQYEILEKSAGYLRNGGTIVYSTCTVNPEENEKITDRFISEHPEFSYSEIRVGALVAESGHITLLPHVHGTDGFYIAKMKKSGKA